MKLRPGQAFPIPFGPFVGQRDSLEPTGQDPKWATLLRNCYIRRKEDGFGAFARPGFQKLAKPATGEAQLLHYVGERSGYQEVYAVVGGGFYKYDLSGTTWTANIKPAGVTINATGRVYAVWYLGKLIVSDGVNRPWKFDPATGTGAYLTEMTTAAYGRPFVYAGKLGFILGTDHTTWLWSNENDPDLGYAANRWTMLQTGSGDLVTFLPTNSGLYYWREDSIGLVMGNAGPDFATAATHDSISDKVGTLSPDSPILVGDTVYFVDKLGAPWYFQLGGKPVPLVGATNTLSDVNKGRLQSIWAVYLDDVEAVAWSMPLSSGSTLNSDLVLFSHLTHASWGTWEHQVSATVDFKVGCRGKDSAGRAVFMHLDADGDFYLQRQKDQAAARYDTLVTNILPEVELRTAWLGYDQDFDKFVDGALLETLRDGSTGPTVTIDYQTNRSAGFSTALVAKVPDGGAADSPSKVEVGLWGEGRYVRLRFRNTNEPSLIQHRYLAGKVRVYAAQAFPGTA